MRGRFRGRVAISQFRERLPFTSWFFPAKYRSFLNFICNRFAAKLNHWFRTSPAAAFPQILLGSPRKSTSSNIVFGISHKNSTFQSEINKSEKPYSNFSRNNLELLGKSLPLWAFSKDNRNSKKICLNYHELLGSFNNWQQWAVWHS